MKEATVGVGSHSKNTLTHGSLFSGVGGFELGAAMCGIETLWSCEKEPFQRSVLRKNFPNTRLYGDIRALQNPAYTDIISGGFPCQDISIAGKGAGIKGSRSRLWTEMFRVCRGIRPKYILIENSSAITFRGLERILCDLSQIGYDAEWQSLQGFDFGIQQGRERTYIIAYPYEVGTERLPTQQVFRQFNVPLQFGRIYPGWRTRSAIPQPRTLRTAHVLPHQLDRVGAIGNAVMPLVALYLFWCIQKREEEIIRKQHQEQKP